jgi:hypothetical protein
VKIISVATGLPEGFSKASSKRVLVIRRSSGRPSESGSARRRR